MSSIFNLTQHPATPEQINEGVVEPADKEQVQRLLTFVKLPTRKELLSRADQLADLVPDDCDSAMIGGAGYLMAPLEKALSDRGIEPLHAFSERVSVEEPQPDGSVKKTNVFRHVGFVGMS